MPDIYEQHKAAFSRVSAHVVTDGSTDRIASVAFKYPADGAGRLWCYLHVFGAPMVRAYASGGGYDKHSAAVHSALAKVKAVVDSSDVRTFHRVANMCEAVQDDGRRWDQDLTNAGFAVLQAV